MEGAIEEGGPCDHGGEQGETSKNRTEQKNLEEKVEKKEKPAPAKSLITLREKREDKKIPPMMKKKEQGRTTNIKEMIARMNKISKDNQTPNLTKKEQQNDRQRNNEQTTKSNIDEKTSNFKEDDKNDNEMMNDKKKNDNIHKHMTINNHKHTQATTKDTQKKSHKPKQTPTNPKAIPNSVSVQSNLLSKINFWEKKGFKMGTKKWVKIGGK